MNIDYDEGRDAGRTWIREAIKKAIPEIAPADENQGVREKKTDLSNQYIFARLSGKVIRELVRLDAERAASQAKKAKKAEKPRQSKKRGKATVRSDAAALYRFRAIYRIWPDFKISPCIAKSLATVKADAAQTSFCAHGAGITWAIMDSGIDANHPHFALHGNVDPASPLHSDFNDTPNVPRGSNAALIFPSITDPSSLKNSAECPRRWFLRTTDSPNR